MLSKATPKAGDHVTESTSRVWLVLGVREKNQEFNFVYSYMVCFRDFFMASLLYLSVTSSY